MIAISVAFVKNDCGEICRGISFINAACFGAAFPDPIYAPRNVNGNETPNKSDNDESNAVHVITSMSLVDHRTICMMKITPNTMPGHRVDVSRALDCHAMPRDATETFVNPCRNISSGCPE